MQRDKGLRDKRRAVHHVVLVTMEHLVTCPALCDSPFDAASRKASFQRQAELLPIQQALELEETLFLLY